MVTCQFPVCNSLQWLLSLADVKVGISIIGFAQTVANSSPAKVRRFKLSLKSAIEKSSILDQMLRIFEKNCSFYEFSWYEI